MMETYWVEPTDEATSTTVSLEPKLLGRHNRSHSFIGFDRKVSITSGDERRIASANDSRKASIISSGGERRIVSPTNSRRNTATSSDIQSAPSQQQATQNVPSQRGKHSRRSHGHRQSIRSKMCTLL